MNATMPPRKVSLYRVTASTVSTVPVGQLLVEKSGKKVKRWDLFDFLGDGGWTGFTGRRVARLCPTCVHGSERAAVLGHPGDCGPDAPLVDVPSCEAAAVQPKVEAPAAVTMAETFAPALTDVSVDQSDAASVLPSSSTGTT